MHQRRERRACFGELVQIDGSPHAWFENRGSECCLIVFIDDATSNVLYAQFEPAETTAAYFRGLYSHIKNYGIPLAYYSDRHMIFRVSNAKTTEVNLTQFLNVLVESLELEEFVQVLPKQRIMGFYAHAPKMFPGSEIYAIFSAFLDKIACNCLT